MVVDPASRATWGRLLVRRWGVATALVASCAGACAAPPPQSLSYEPTGLGWSAAEVERVAARQASSIVEQARRGGELGCRDYCTRLQAVFERLVPVARAQTAAAARLPWSLTVVRTAAVDAISLPGGTVMISETFVRQANPSDAELAFILAHEMAHSVLEHERQALTFARMLLPRDVPRSVADIYTEIDHNFSLLKAMEAVMQQGEIEADELGLLMASAAGYAPQAQLGFIEREAAEAAAQAGERRLVGTHPTPAQRLQHLRLRLPLAERVFGLAGAKAP